MMISVWNCNFQALSWVPYPVFSRRKVWINKEQIERGSDLKQSSWPQDKDSKKRQTFFFFLIDSLQDKNAQIASWSQSFNKQQLSRPSGDFSPSQTAMNWNFTIDIHHSVQMQQISGTQPTYPSSVREQMRQNLIGNEKAVIREQAQIHHTLLSRSNLFDNSSHFSARQKRSRNWCLL